MEKPVLKGDMEEPRFIQEGYEYLGDDEKWHIREDAHDWAKKEFEEFYNQVDSISDKNDKLIQA